MSFSWGRSAGESDNDYNTRYQNQRSKVQQDESNQQSEIDRQQRDIANINNETISLANQKALDALNKQKADRAAGITSVADKTRELNDLTAQYNAQKSLDRVNRDIANQKNGIVSAKDAESEMSDYQQYEQKQALDIANQDKAWANASRYRQSDAEQSNIAQKDRLVAGLDNQKVLQQNTINQANKLRRDDNQRAIDGFKMKF
jgi:hypothetical protein